MGPWGDRYGEVPDGLTLERIKDAEHGIDLGPLVPRAREMIGTPSGKIELAPPYILDDLPRLQAAIERPPSGSCSSAAATCARRTAGCTTSRCW